MPSAPTSAHPRPAAIAPLPLLCIGEPGPRLALARGEFFSLLGPSSAGKSALLGLVAGFSGAGFSGATGRDLLLDGLPIGRTPAHRRGIGYAGPGAALLPHLTVAEALTLPLRAAGLPRATRAERAGRMLLRLGLSEVAAHRPHQLTPEQAVRAALGRALITRPKLLLLDDPLAPLAPPARAALRLDLRRLHGELGLTVLHATADAAEALLLADRVGVIAAGRLHQIGPPQTLYDEPENALVAGLLGEINLVPGLFTDEDDDLATIRLDCGVTVEARPRGVARGQRCVVAVRPERIALAAVAAEEMGPDALPATVQDVLPQGGHIRLRLIVGTQGAPAALLSVTRPAGTPLAGLRPGATVTAAWQPHHATALPAAPAAAPPTALAATQPSGPSASQ